LFYAFITIFLILTFCFFFPYSGLLSPKPVNLNVVKFYFISCFFLLFIYFFSDLIKYDFIDYFYNFLFFSSYFTLIFVTPFIRRYAQKNMNSRLLIIFLRLSSLLVIILFSKNIFFYFYFLWEGRNLYYEFKRIKEINKDTTKVSNDADMIISKNSLFERVFLNARVYLAITPAMFFLVTGIFGLGAAFSPVVVAYAVFTYTPETVAKNWAIIVFCQDLWIFSWFVWLFTLC